MNDELSRRRFLKDTALLAGAVAAMQSVDRQAAGAAAPATMPTIRLGHVEVSRLILGSNPFFGYSYQSGDLDRQMKEYYRLRLPAHCSQRRRLRRHLQQA